MRTVFKLSSKVRGKHVHTTLFAGKEGQTLANTGTLVMNIGEFQLFGAMLSLGADTNHRTKETVKIEGNDPFEEKEKNP